MSPLLFSIFEDVITEKAKSGIISEVLHTDDFLLISKTLKDWKEKFWNWKEAPENMDLKVNSRKIYLVISWSKGELFKSKIGLCAVVGRE